MGKPSEERQNLPQTQEPLWRGDTPDHTREERQHKHGKVNRVGVHRTINVTPQWQENMDPGAVLELSDGLMLDTRAYVTN